MATHNAAYAAGIDDVVGQLNAGHYADLVLFRRSEEQDAYGAAVNASVDDVALVWLDGKPVFADIDIAEQMGLAPGCVELTAADKFMCADLSAVGMSWDDIMTMTADAVPINGDTGGQAPCDATNIDQ